MDGPLNLLAPYEQSAAFDVTEKQLQQLFIDVFNEVFADQVSDIHHYGMPHLGSPKVVERFTKQDGLVVLRRPTSSDLIMRIIYTDWKSLASRRGLAFLEFVLQMLLGNQWKIYRLYHSSLRAEKYPELVTLMKTADSFLTSRIMIDLSQDVDFSEILELAPVLFRLVPANIVPSLSSSVEFSDLNNFSAAIGFIPYMSAHFQDMTGYSLNYVENLEWSDWVLNKIISVNNHAIATYRAFKSNGMEIFKSYAIYDLKPLVHQVLSDSLYQSMSAVRSAIESIHGGPVNGYEFAGNANSVSVSLKIAETNINYSDVLDVILQRMSLQHDFPELTDLAAVVSSVNWFIEDWQVKESITAPLSMRSVNKYSGLDVVDYSSYYAAAQKQAAYSLQNNASWAGRVLGSLYLEQEFEDHANYIQEYQVDGVGGETLIVIQKAINPDFVGVDAVIGSPVSRHELLELLIFYENSYEHGGNVSNLVQSAYSPGPQSTNALFNSLIVTYTRQQISTAIIRNLNSSKPIYASNSMEFMQSIANTSLINNPAYQLVKFSDLLPQFNENAERVAVPDASYAPLTNVSLQVIEYV